MVDSDRGITNLHVPSDVIIDASMPAAIRSSGQMWNAEGRAAGHQVRHPGLVLRRRSTPRPSTSAGSTARSTPPRWAPTPNVGLMAQKAEEYGSHDKTFEIAAAGTVRVVDALRHGAARARGRRRATSGARARPRTPRSATGWSWPSPAPAPPAPLPCSGWTRRAATTPRCSRRCGRYLADAGHRRPDHRDPRRSPRPPGTRWSGTKRGEDTISVTGNVLRDYLTDLFPIMELGTSAKMLSIVPLMNGGGLFETGAGGSAPKHVQQLVQARTTCAGTRSASSSRWPSRWSSWPTPTTTRAPSCWARPSTTPPGSCSRTGSRRRGGSASWTTAAATSTWRCTGPRPSPSRTRTRSWRRSSRRWPSGWPPTRRRSSTS